MEIVNPVLKGFNPDPSICRAGEDYYIATSTFEWFPGVQIHHSKDLVNWHLVSQPLDRVELLDMKGNPDSGGVWAPQLSYYDNQFWLIYSDVKTVEGNVWKDVNNYLTTSKTIDGNWSAPIYMNSSGFDPSLYHDDDGKKYFMNMLWDARDDKHSFYGIVMQEYDSNQEKLIGESKVIYKGTDWGLVEAPHIYKKDGYYYLIVAEGGTLYGHQQTVARSENIWGPYETHPENPLITSWPHPTLELQRAGHASMVETTTGEWYLAHLTSRPIHKAGEKLADDRGYSPLGRESAIQKLYWEDDWPYVVGGNKPSVRVKGPDIPQEQWDQNYPTLDDFDSEKLNHNFQTLRIPFNDELGSLTAREGYLRLYGRESFHSVFVQSLVARRWQSLDFTAETKLEYNPDTFQQQAGLVCYYNTRHWTSLHVTWHEEKGRILEVRSCENYETSTPTNEKLIVIPEDVQFVYMRVEVNEKNYQFSYSFDGEKWEIIPYKFDSYKLSDEYIQQAGQAGFFTGAFVGMSSIDGSGRRFPADFDYFKYEEN